VDVLVKRQQNPCVWYRFIHHTLTQVLIRVPFHALAKKFGIFFTARSFRIPHSFSVKVESVIKRLLLILHVNYLFIRLFASALLITGKELKIEKHS
jgi:hypothetical protein